MKILVIEDDVRVANLLADAIRSEGHEALVAVTPETGLRLFERERPDGIFLDIVMPQQSGFEVLQQIRRAVPALPVVVISGFATPELTAEATRLGATYVVEKPLLLKHLSSALASLKSPPDQRGK
jgi:DNA-binding response OmpR family regulator